MKNRNVKKNLFVEQWNIDKEEILKDLREKKERLLPGTAEFKALVNSANTHMSDTNNATSDSPRHTISTWADLQTVP